MFLYAACTALTHDLDLDGSVESGGEGGLGHGFDRRDALSPERGGRDVHAHALDEQKGKASQRSHENLPFGPVGANHTGDVLICGLHGANP